MRHRKAGKKIGRTSEHRKATFRNMVAALFEHERITTTVEKAKAFKPRAEKLISLGRVKTLHNVRRAQSILQDKDMVKKLFDELGPRYKDRPGGYTRILRLPGYRLGDGGSKAIFELVDNEVLAAKLALVAEEQAE
ncbi:MAG: 50S ribosomal protein L17 [Planctomycetes bacterium]|jgi:large subunit ribosomal protein L17|nr:50S ribosomal protein L17 [Planctomycetota bacterium]